MHTLGVEVHLALMAGGTSSWFSHDGETIGSVCLWLQVMTRTGITLTKQKTVTISRMIDDIV